MKSVFRLCLYTILVSASVEAGAQGFVENALLFSRTKPGGSARIQAMGGAQVALGGDFSSALSNPAGLGMYNRSEFTFSPAFNTYETEAAHLGTKSNDSKNVFNVPGLSYVHHLPQEKNGFLGGSFGISMTRVNDFNTAFQYNGVDDVSSIVDYFIEDATGFNPDNFNGDILTELGYNNYLIEDSSFYGANDTDYFSVMGVYPDDPDDIRRLTRNGSVKIRGAQYQWSLAYGGNFNDKLFFGANIGITTLRYSFTSNYKESNFSFDLSPGYNPLNLLEVEESVDIDGTGVNLTLGIIYRPINMFQIGIAFLSPTYYNISDSYNSTLRTQWNNFDYLDQGEILNSVSSDLIEPIVSEYKITTPLKLNTGATIFLGKYGFITGDVEFVNYNKAKYDSDTPDVSFGTENEYIKFYYTNVINYRTGAEFRYSNFRLRGGYSIQKNPYKKEFDVNQEIETFSAGAGVRFNKFYIDVAWLKSKGNSSFSQYVLDNGTGPVASLKNTSTSVMATVGFTF